MRRICRNKVSHDGVEIPFTEGKSYIFVEGRHGHQWQWMESDGDHGDVWYFSLEVYDIWYVGKWFYTEQETREIILDDLV